MHSDNQWQMVLARDPRGEGRFVYAVRSTGIYCRPTCPSRRPRRGSVEFFDSPAAAERAGYRACQRCRPASAHPQAAAVTAMCRYIDERVEERITLADISRPAGLSPFHAQRLFKRTLGISPREYQAARRAEQLHERLRIGSTVTDAMHGAGYGSASRLYDSGATLGMNPSFYRKRGEGTAIRFTTFPSALGTVLLAATERGLCRIALGDDAAALEAGLRRDFQLASIQRDQGGLEELAGNIRDYLAGERLRLDLPLDVQATAFQRRVWDFLRTIPYGETRTYSEVAAELGQPQAARAVARACATNEVALAVPCHRVVGVGGKLSGYRWGLQRKAELLEREAGARRAADVHLSGDSETCPSSRTASS